MNNEKLVINPKGDTLRLGADFHTLEDRTVSTFQTQHLGEFARFMEKDRAHIKPPILILCSDAKVTAIAEAPDRYTKPVAVCDLSHSDPLTELMALKNRKTPLSTFTEFMESFKRFTSQDGMALLDNLRHFRLKKVLSVESNKDNKGNFAFRLALESGGKDDFEPPSTLVFAVPVYKFQEHTFTHTFELHFAVDQSAGDPVLAFTLKTFNFDEMLLKRKKEIVDEVLAALPQEKLWGEQSIHQQDDAWKYRANPLPEAPKLAGTNEANPRSRY